MHKCMMANVTGHFSHGPDCNATLSLKVEKKHRHYPWAWGFLVEAFFKAKKQYTTIKHDLQLFC